MATGNCMVRGQYLFLRGHDVINSKNGVVLGGDKEAIEVVVCYGEAWSI
jgi:hypothetical protein